MIKEATHLSTEMALLSEQALDAVTGGGRSHCEGDDGSASGGGGSGGSGTPPSGSTGSLDLASINIQR